MNKRFLPTIVLIGAGIILISFLLTYLSSNQRQKQEEGKSSGQHNASTLPTSSVQPTIVLSPTDPRGSCVVPTSENSFRNMVDALKNPQNVCYLYLRNQNLTQLPTEIQSLSNLISLNVSDNQLTTIPSFVWRMPSLRVINASNNNISTLSTNAQKGSVTSVILSGNPISEEEKQVLRSVLLNTQITY